jgi:hypothetical protein
LSSISYIFYGLHRVLLARAGGLLPEVERGGVRLPVLSVQVQAAPSYDQPHREALRKVVIDQIRNCQKDKLRLVLTISLRRSVSNDLCRKGGTDVTIFLVGLIFVIISENILSYSPSSVGYLKR